MNWKYILIVVILAVIVGGGILAYQYWWVPTQEIKSPKVKTPEEIIKDETANWEVSQIGGFQIKYPSSTYPCITPDAPPPEGIRIHLSGECSNDFTIIDYEYGTGVPGTRRICGKDYDDCVRGFVDGTQYEKERTINNIQGKEFVGTIFGGAQAKKFVFETSRRNGIVEIIQTKFSPELDSIYEKILTTISSSD